MITISYIATGNYASLSEENRGELMEDIIKEVKKQVEEYTFVISNVGFANSKNLKKNKIMINVQMSLMPKESFGLNHSVETLSEMRQSIPFLPVEAQAKYADGVCMEMVKENIDLVDTLRIHEENIDLVVMNTTSFGNLAYIALNARNTEARELALKILEKCKEISLP